MATTIATSTFAQPTVRAGSRAIIKLGNGNLLVVYHDGSAGFKSKEASSEANLSGATAVTIASTTDANDPKSYCLWPDGVLLSVIGSSAGASSYQTYATGAWTAHSAPPVFGNYNEVSGFKSGTSFYFTSWGNFTAEFDSHYATSFGGAFSGLGQNNVANSDGVDNQGLVALPWNSKILCLLLDSGRNLQWYSKDTLAGVNGGNFQAATSLETIAAGGTYQNNLAGVTDSNGNAWMAYNDNTGIQLRMLTSAGVAWTAKTAVTAQASDKSPALFQDTNGNIWVFWIDGGAGNAVKAQKATVSGGAISLSGTVQTVVGTAATRNNLSSIESDGINAYLVWAEGSGSPYNVVVHAYAVSGGPVTSTRTIPASVALKATLTRSVPSTVALLGTSTRTVPASAALLATLTRSVPTTAALLATNARTVAATIALLGTQTRTISATAALLGTATRIVPSSAALKATNTRTIPTTVALSGAGTNSRTVAASIALLGTATRTVPASIALLATQARSVPSSVALLATLSRTLPASAALQATLSRSVSATAALKATLTRTIPTTVALVGVSFKSALKGSFTSVSRLHAGFASVSRYSASFLSGSRYKASFVRSVTMAQPYSTVDVTITVTKSDNSVPTVNTLTVSVLFPDGTTQSFSLAAGTVTSLGSGQYKLTYTTGGAGPHRETWLFTAADGSVGEFENVTYASF